MLSPGGDPFSAHVGMTAGFTALSVRPSVSDRDMFCPWNRQASGQVRGISIKNFLASRTGVERFAGASAVFAGRSNVRNYKDVA